MGNSTDSPPFEFSDYTQRVVVATMFLIASVVGAIGNSLVIVAVLLSKKLRTVTNAFVVNLSIADLLTSLALPWNTVALLSVDGFPVGDWVCKVVAIVLATSVGCSLYMLASIALNRLLLITRATTTYQIMYTPKKIAVLLILTWLFPLVITLLPPLLNMGAIGYIHQYHMCGLISWPPKSIFYKLIIAGAFYPLPRITIIVCYILLWMHLKRHAKMMVSCPEPNIDSTANNLSTVSNHVDKIATPNNPGTSTGTIVRSGTLSRKRMSHRQYKITKNMFYIVCAFMLCLTPYAICLVFDRDSAIPYAAAILFINSCVNPFIYATKHPHFKTVFSCMLHRQWDHIPEPSDTLKALRGRHLCGRSGLNA